MAAPTTNASVTTNPGGTGTNIVPTLPAHAVGDVIEIWVVNSGVVAWSAPAGWTIKQQQASSGNASTGVIGTLLYRRVLAGDTLPLASPTCTLGATVTRSAVALTKRGSDLESVHLAQEWLAFGSTTGTANPVRPPAVVTRSPENLVHIYYGSRGATNAPDQTNYTQVQEVIVSGTIVNNVSQRTIADQNTSLANQDASPTSGARWIAMISCTPSPDYPYYRSGSQAFSASATSSAPALPTGTTASDNRGNKDLIIMTAECAGATPSPNTPADWTLIAEWSNTTSGGATTVRKWAALYDGTLDRQVNRSPAGEILVYLSVYHNAHQSVPVGTSAVQQNASSTTSPFPALLRTGTKATVQATCIADATPTFTPPAGWTERNDSQGMTCADQTFNATGSTASASFTLSTASPTLCGLTAVFSVASVITTTLTPASATLTVTGFAPIVTTTAHVTATPASASLALTGLAPLPVMDGTLADDFNDNSRDASKWTLGSVAFSNPSVGVNEANQQIEITPLSNEVSPAIYGYKSVSNWNFTGREVVIRIAADIASDVEAWLVVARDVDNYFRTWVAGGNLQTRSRVAASNSNQSHGAFSFATHTYWKIWHDSGSDEIVWEYSSNGSTWNELRRLARPFAITSASFYLSGGTGGSVASPALVKFDDFNLASASVEEVVTPAQASLALTAFVPALVISLTPATRSLTLTTFAPSLTIAVTVPNAALSLTTFAPEIRISPVITPAPASLTLTSSAVQLREVVTIASQSLTLTGYAPGIATAVIPSTATLTLSTFAPSLVHVLIPSTQTLSLTANAPQLRQVTTPAATTLTLTAFAPTVTVSAHVTVTPSTQTLTLTGFAPALHARLTPNATALSLTTFAPAIDISADRTVQPAAASLTLALFAPRLRLILTPTTATLAITSSAPVLRVSLTPGAATLTAAGLAPVLIFAIQPPSTSLTLIAFAPIVTGPAVNDVIVTPFPASLQLVALAPWLFTGNVPASRTFMVDSGCYEVVVHAGEYEILDSHEDNEVVVF